MITALIFLAGIGAGCVVAFCGLAVFVALDNAVERHNFKRSLPVLVPHGPKCLRKDLPLGAFFDGESIRFNCNIPPHIEDELIALGDYERVPDDTIVQPLRMMLRPEACTRGLLVPDRWVDEFHGTTNGDEP